MRTKHPLATGIAAARSTGCVLCGKRRPEVPRLIIGLNGAICYNCVDLCAKIIATDNWSVTPEVWNAGSEEEPGQQVSASPRRRKSPPRP
jgi:ATP-dependent Clp protease ATP-binding subunit ClpX